MKMKKETRIVQGFNGAHCAVIGRLGIRTRFVPLSNELTTWGDTSVLEDIAIRPDYASEIPAFSDFSEAWKLFAKRRGAIISFIKSSSKSKMPYVEAFERIGVDLTVRELERIFMCGIEEISSDAAESIDPRHITHKLVVFILQDAAKRWNEGKMLPM